MARRAENELRQEGWKGRVRYQRTVDVRYKGQGYELNMPYSRRLPVAFQAEHRRRYGYGYQSRELELVTLRLRATVKSPVVKWRNPEVSSGGSKPERVRVFMDGKAVPTLVHDRASLLTGRIYAGPAIVTEYSATTVVPPKAKFHVDQAGNLILTL